MHIVRLTTVDAFIAFDLEDCDWNAGGTRLAPDVTEEEAALLARAMTYKFAVLGRQAGGAKGAIRATPENRADAMARYLAEIRPMVDARTFGTGADLGTNDADFAPLRDPTRDRGPMGSTIDGVHMEDVITGLGVTAAIDAATGGVEGRTVAIEGFGKVGGGVAREVERRGGKVVAVSTLSGSVHEPKGFAVDRLWQRRAEHGDDLVLHLDSEVRPPAALFEAEADVLVPGARTGVLDATRAAKVNAQFVVPASNAPYTADGLRGLRERGVAAHADFICNAGAVIGFTSPDAKTPEDLFGTVDSRVTKLINACLDDPEGPHAAACRLAEDHLRTWRGPDGLPPGPPLAL